MKKIISYDEAIKILTSQEKFHICLGLDRISEILNYLNNPQKSLKIIHIAGTNGKGSVSKILSEILKMSGYKTGLYTSPHILKYTERIKINGKNIPEQEFADLIKYIMDLSKEKNIYLTEFEILTAAMYKYFSDKNTDICVIETGLGGRLDATNVIESNILSIITSISLDHTDRLGNTIEKIAYEKGGIIKPNCPVIFSPNNKGAKVLTKTAHNKNANIIPADNNIELEFINNINYAYINGFKYEFNLMGLWQKENLNLVYEAIKYLNQNSFNISNNSLSNALKNVKWNSRFQYIKEQNIIIDGTHNPDGAKLLRKSLDYYFPYEKRCWIYGSMKNKDYMSIMRTLFRKEDNINFCSFNHLGSMNAHDLQKKLTEYNSKIIDIKNIERFISARQNNSLTIISGSFYMIGDIMKNNTNLKKIAEVDNI